LKLEEKEIQLLEFISNQDGFQTFLGRLECLGLLPSFQAAMNATKEQD
jgi:hypothetical protein